MLFSHFWGFFPNPTVVDFITATGQSDHALLFTHHNVSHAFAVPAVEIGAHTQTNHRHTYRKPTHAHKHKERKRATVLPTSTVA